MFDPSNAFIDCPKCDSARHVERVNGEQWFCNCCAHQFAVPSTAPEAGSLMGRVAREEVRQPTAALQFVAAVVLVALLPIAGNAQSLVFSDDGASAPWSANHCVSVAVAVDGGLPKEGPRMRQCNLGVQELALNSWSYGTRFLFRTWFRYDANVDHKAGSKHMRIGFQSPFEVLFACQFENGAAATFFVSINGRGSFWGNRPTAAICGDRQWHKLEIAREDNGPLRFWVDDVLVTGTPNDWANVGGRVGALYMPSNWSQNPGWEHDSVNHVYFDETRIYSDLGTGATGSIMDGTIGEGGSTPPPPPPAPVDCAGTWGTWTRQADSESACSANGTRTFTESRLFTVSRTPANGGAACPASPESRTVTENCAAPVPSVTYTCSVRSVMSAYSDGDVRRTIRCETNGPVPDLPVGATFTVTVPKK